VGQKTALYQAGARFYSGVFGAFLSPDPLGPVVGDPRTLNPYSYAANNPMRYTDEYGLCFGEAMVACPEGLTEFAVGYVHGMLCCLAPMLPASQFEPELVPVTVLGVRAMELAGPGGGARVGVRAGAKGAALLCAAVCAPALDAIGIGTLFSDGGSLEQAVEAEKERIAQQLLENPELARGATADEIENIIPASWEPQAARSKNEEGIRSFKPGTGGSDGIRVMHGNPNAADPHHQGPRVIITHEGRRTSIPLDGNPTLR
jgi:RHS repeat-associated protein